MINQIIDNESCLNNSSNTSFFSQIYDEQKTNDQIQNYNLSFNIFENKFQLQQDKTKNINVHKNNDHNDVINIDIVQIDNIQEKDNEVQNKIQEDEKQLQIQKQITQTRYILKYQISSIQQNQSMLQYIINESKEDSLILVIILVTAIICSKQLFYATSCQIYGEQYAFYCYDYNQWIASFIIQDRMVFIGQSFAITYLIKAYFDIQIYEFILIQIFYVILTFHIFEIFYLPAFLTYLAIKKIQFKMKLLKLIEIIILIIAIFMIMKIYTQIVILNPYEINFNILVLLSNFLCTIGKILTHRLLEIRLRCQKKYYIDIRYVIIQFYLIEIGIIFSQMMKLNDEFLLSQIFFSQIVTTTYYLTQFHLWFYLFKLSVRLLRRIFYFKQCDKILIIILKSLNYIWIECEKYYYLIKKTHYDDDQSIQVSQEFIINSDIQRIFASYFVIAHIFQYIQISLTLLSKMHLPWPNYEYEKYQKYNIKYVDTSIHFEIYQLTLAKLLIHMSIFLLTFLGVIIYGQKKNLQFFVMKKLRLKHNLISHFFMILALSINLRIINFL